MKKNLGMNKLLKFIKINIERGFLKDPMASTIFLESPKRITALMMVMTLCLQIYAALEYRIRQAFTTTNFP